MSKERWKHSKDKIFSLQYFVEIAYNGCIAAMVIITCLLLYQDYLFGGTVVTALSVSSEAHLLDGVRSSCIINVKTSRIFKVSKW